MAKLTLTNTSSGYASTAAINANNDLIETAVENTLSRDGTTPNQMGADFDMNGYNILNQGNPITISGWVWEGTWATSTTYTVGDVVQEAGSAYICIVAHTSGTFSTDLSAAKWQLVVQANLPSQTGNSGATLFTDGANPSWQRGMAVVTNVYNLLQLSDKTDAYVENFFTTSKGGGGHFYWDSTQDKANADGGTIIDPDTLDGWAGASSNIATTYYGASGQGTGVGTGCWMRVIDSPVHIGWFGTAGDGALSGAAEAGAGTGTDDSTPIQKALDYIRDNGGTLVFDGSRVHRCDTALTLLRTSTTAPTEYNLQFNGAALDFSNLASGDYLKVGADSLANIATDVGQITISRPKIFGQQTGNPGSGTASTNTDTRGILLEFAYNVVLEHPVVSRCYIGLKTTYAFPIASIGAQLKRNVIGYWIDDVTNDSTHIGMEVPLCRFGIVVQPAGTYDTGKCVNNAFYGVRAEGNEVGIHIDPGTGAVGQGIIRDFIIDAPYFSANTYDHIRAGSVCDPTTSSSRGADRTDRVYGLNIRGGNWGGTWSATKAAIYVGSNWNVREMTANLPIDGSDTNAFVNNPRYSQVIFTSQQGSTGDMYRVTQYGALGEKWTEPQKALQTMVNIDATPDVSFHCNFETNTGGPFTITDFDNGEEGQEITVISRAAVTYDTTGTNLTGSSVDVVTASGDITKWFCEDGTTWTLLAFVDVSADNSGGA